MRISIGVAAALLLAAGCAGRRPAAVTDGREQGSAAVADAREQAMARTEADAGGCLETLAVDRSRSPLSEQRAAGGQPLDDFPRRIAAQAIEPARQTPIRALDAHRIDGQPLLWLSADKRAIVVDRRYFSDLEVADPTRMSEGESARIGRLTDEGKRKIGGRALLRFLLAAEVIRSYWHLEASVCIERETEDGGAYQAQVSGVHTYYTNQRNQRRFAFSFRVEPDGTITVSRKAA